MKIYIKNKELGKLKDENKFRPSKVQFFKKHLNDVMKDYSAEKLSKSITIK